jgi:hypothetical protein
MANTTFTGAVRSENGFQVISKAADTGVETTKSTIDSSGNFTTDGAVADHKQVIRQTTYTDWNDAALTLTTSANGAVILFDKDEATTVTLPAVTASDIGVQFIFVETVASDNLRSVVTAYDNDYFVGGVQLGTTAAENGAKGFIPTGGTDTTIKFDDNLANGAGSLGSTVTLTAVLTGNTGAGGGAKLAWLVTGSMGTADDNSTGAAIFA